MGAYSRVPITWRGMRAVRAIGCLRHSRPGSIADVVKRPVVPRNRGGVSRGRDGMQKVALHNWGCSWGLNPPVSRRQRVM